MDPGEPFSLPSTLPLTATAAVMVVARCWLSSVVAGAPGLNVMDAWGMRRFVAWSDVKPASLTRESLIHPPVRLVDRQGHSSWIARDTRDLGALHAIAVGFGGAGHPLARVLPTPLHRLQPARPGRQR